MKKFFIISSAVFCCSAFQSSETASEIVQKSEQKLRAATVVAEMNIELIRPKWSKQMELKVWIKGVDYAAAYVLAPQADSGTVFLKSKEEVWNYLPKVKKTIKMPVNVLSQTWMGSDMSNDDLLNASTFSRDFNAALIGSVQFMNNDCYHIQLSPKPGINSIWGKIELYIEKEDYIQLHAQFFDEELELKHSVTGYDVKLLGGRKLPSKYVLLPNKNRDQRTVITYSYMDFDKEIADVFFDKNNITLIRP